MHASIAGKVQVARHSKLARRARRFGAQAKQHYLLVLLALLAGFLTWLLFTFLIGGQGGFWSNVLAGFFTNLLSFVILYLIFTRQGVTLPGGDRGSDMGALVGFYSRHEDVDWSAVIRDARQVDIVVHYYSRWVREQSEAFTAFFQRAGAVRLVMADPEIEATLEDVRRYFFPRLNTQQLTDRILETDTRLKEALDASGSQKAVLETWYFPEPLHYSFVLIDRRYLYLSVYEQDRGPVIRSSVFELDLLLDGALDDYWQRNLQWFFERSRRVR